MKKLYRSKTNRIIGGVIGGLGEYFNIDPVILRLVWVVIVVFTALIPGIVVYILGMFIIPEAPTHTHTKQT
jgi:phage shock protein C